MARRGRRTGLSNKEAKGLIALIAVIFLAIIKIVEYSAKAVARGVHHISDDIRWTSEGIRNYQGNWRIFYDQALHRKVFKYIAIISATVGLIFLPYRQIAGLLFIGAACISYFFDKDIFSSLSRIAKEIIVAILIVSGLISNSLYQKSEIETAQQERTEQVRQFQQEAALKKKQAALIDSSNKLISLGRVDFLHKKYERANALFDQALLLSPTNDNALYLKGLYFKATKRVDKAIPFFAQIGVGSEKYDDALIEKGLNLIRKGDKKQAVASFKEAASLNNFQGKKLYNRYNPIRRTIIGYVTRCCDGTSSGASGRGACSHHGGVCNWNDPIYNESRKYE